MIGFAQVMAATAWLQSYTQQWGIALHCDKAVVGSLVMKNRISDDKSGSSQAAV
jgi:hypothetical protein